MVDTGSLDYKEWGRKRVAREQDVESEWDPCGNDASRWVGEEGGDRKSVV